jgi:hypothetical protein
MSKQNTMPNPYQGLSKEQVLETMRQLVVEETRNHILMGLLYNYLVDSKLLKGTSFKSPLEYICSNIHEVSRAALLAYGAVTRAFTQQVCAQFGVYRLRYLLTYKDAAKIELNHDELGGTFILVPNKNGEVKPKLFANCSVEDMRQAIQHLRQGGSEPIPDEERALVDQYREAVTGRFAQGTPVRVQLRSHKGQTVVDFKGIPVLQVDKLTEALLDQLYPVREMPVTAQASQVS